MERTQLGPYSNEHNSNSESDHGYKWYTWDSSSNGHFSGERCNQLNACACPAATGCRVYWMPGLRTTLFKPQSRTTTSAPQPFNHTDRPDTRDFDPLPKKKASGGERTWKSQRAKLVKHRSGNGTWWYRLGGTLSPKPSSQGPRLCHTSGSKPRRASRDFTPPWQ